MKLLVTFSIIIFLLCCSVKEGASKLEFNDDSIQNASSNSNLVGFVDFNLLQNAEHSETIEILMEDGKLYASIFERKLIIDGKSFDLKESDVDELSNLIGTEFFEPEYDLMVAKCYGEISGFYKVLIGKNYKLVKKGGNVSFVNFASFFEDKLISTKLSPVLEWPNEESDVAIYNYEEYAYEVVEVDGDWLKVKILKDVHGEVYPNTGWLKWRKDESILIEIMYSL